MFDACSANTCLLKPKHEVPLRLLDMNWIAAGMKCTCSVYAIRNRQHMIHMLGAGDKQQSERLEDSKFLHT